MISYRFDDFSSNSLEIMTSDPIILVITLETMI